MKLRNVVASLAVLLGVSFVNLSQAAVITESSDVGQSLQDAFILPAGTTTISGSLAEDVDLFGFGWGGGLFDVTTNGSSITDTQLFLFDAIGRGVWFNDDITSSTNMMSRIIDSDLKAGFYYLAVAPYNNDPQDALNQFIFPDTWSGMHSALQTSSLDHWSGGGYTGNYLLTFNTPTSSIPNIGTLLLMLSGLFFMVRRRRA